jgi:uncharacterized protein YdeI (YjbR/CyaY-like superfamily)
MPKSAKNPAVDGYFSKARKWRNELEKLRTILLDSPATEELKWGKPCYTFQEQNLFILHGLKESCALAFTRGALLKDAKGILAAPGPNSQSTRWIKFTSVAEIDAMESTLKAYIHEAIEAEKAGLKVTFKKITEFAVPEEFQKKLDENPKLKAAYHALTPGRRRGYLLHFSAPKQSQTRVARIEKCTPQILDGKGLNDR